jgi:HEPN domain-containing protein
LLHAIAKARTHIIAALLERVETSGLAVPEEIREASDLTDYAVHTRYPGFYEPVTEQEFKESPAVAERVVAWIKANLEP